MQSNNGALGQLREVGVAEELTARCVTLGTVFYSQGVLRSQKGGIL